MTTKVNKGNAVRIEERERLNLGVATYNRDQISEMFEIGKRTFDLWGRQNLIGAPVYRVSNFKYWTAEQIQELAENYLKRYGPSGSNKKLLILAGADAF